MHLFHLKKKSEERILGGGEFVEQVLKETPALLPAWKSWADSKKFLSSSPF